MFHIRGLSPLLGGLTIIERSWNSGNLLYLVANTYGLNFINRRFWTFHGGQGGSLFHYCDLELDSMTFISELDLHMVLIYHCAKKKVSIPSASKVTAQTDTQTETQTRRKHYLSTWEGGKKMIYVLKQTKDSLNHHPPFIEVAKKTNAPRVHLSKHQCAHTSEYLKCSWQSKAMSLELVWHSIHNKAEVFPSSQLKP